MPTVKVSPKYQVVIPRVVREALQLSPGQQIEVLLYNGRIELIPLNPIQTLRGYLRGMDTSLEREMDRPL